MLLRSLATALLALGIAFVVWRWKAPSYAGQDLIVPIDVEERFELLLLGDMGTGGPSQKAVAQAMERYCSAHKLSAVVMLGDNFYPHGVSSVRDPQWESKFREIYDSPCLGKIPFYAMLGNHDYKGTPQAQIDFKSDSPSWKMPHRFYELQFGKRLQIVVLDTNILDVCGFSSYCTLDFMFNALKHADGRTSIVVGHHPLASSSVKYTTSSQGMLLEKLLCDKASAYISGHSHHLEHRKASSCELDEFISGGGGADLYAVRNERSGQNFAQSTFGFLSLKVDADTLEYTFFNSDLNSLYIYRQTDPSRPPSDGAAAPQNGEQVPGTQGASSF